MRREILIVDDQPGIRLLLQEVFINEGYQVETANTGKEALEKIHSNTFDLIMLDYKLPIVDGAEVLQRLEEQGITTPAILMSGLAEGLVKESEKYSMVQEVIAKPFNIQDVCSTVKTLLDRKVQAQGEGK
ncbi:response regulator [Lentibacillus sp. Marseille-P4043]|uniref:response regulator n=1 Tax=Lentibacillus sp. Marseille-P4043 TaxID=2040293 RepID=UPI000D0BD443|nr:response regulator [Lentibacillus sp. Marseille-P4043]